MTKWDIPNLPITEVKGLVAKPPFSWFEKGTITIEVEDKWQLNDTVDIDMDWRIRMEDAKVRIPKEASLKQKALALPITTYINHKEDIDLRFALVLNKEQFESVSSLDASGLWDSVIKGMSQKLSNFKQDKVDKTKDYLNDKVDGFKNFLDKRRKE